MLREFRHVKQEQHSGRRRWFESDGLDLVVWHDAENRLEGFQLCYDFGHGEHALTWRPGAGFAHAAIDSGEAHGGSHKLTPVLVPDGAVPWSELRTRFAERSADLEPALRDLVAQRLAARG